MIIQYRFGITSDTSLDSSVAYPLYSWMMHHAPFDFADAVHEQGETPIAQYVAFREKEPYAWTVTLLGEEACAALAPLLEDVQEIELHRQTIRMQLEEKVVFRTAEDFLTAHSGLAGNRLILRFHTATSFKQNGRYALFPQEKLILQSVIAKWNALFPMYSLADEDAFRMLENGIHIVDYRLRSLRYPMKNTRISGFVGQIVLDARLSAPMMELWRLIAAFAPYCGVGIKTALGMGGVSVEKI